MERAYWIDAYRWLVRGFENTINAVITNHPMYVRISYFRSKLRGVEGASHKAVPSRIKSANLS